MSVLLAVLVEIKNFDTIHATDTEFLDEEKQECKELLYWLYLVPKGDMSISSIPTKPSSSHDIIKVFKTLTNEAFEKVPVHLS